ncbi:hypothetical protein EB093_00865 [bacterium]|nr:hypothetical protein [bacterium]
MIKSVVTSQFLTFGYLPVAMMLGGLHALEPGHAKTLTAAYLIGIKGTRSDAVLLGLAVAITHTAVVIALAIGVVIMGQNSLSEVGVRWLEVGSAVIVIALGTWMLLSRWLHRLRHHNGHDHHHHELPDYVGTNHRPGRLQIILFGAAGGLLPCPASITVMLLALSVGQPISGLLAVIGFSIGLALTLVAFGVMVVTGISRFTQSTGRLNRISQWSPLISALMVIASGIAALMIHY